MSVHIKYARREKAPVCLHILGHDLVDQLHAEARDMFIRFENIQKLALDANRQQSMGIDTAQRISDILHQCHIVLD